jgi:hypothetical protein
MRRQQQRRLRLLLLLRQQWAGMTRSLVSLPLRSVVFEQQ